MKNKEAVSIIAFALKNDKSVFAIKPPQTDHIYLYTEVNHSSQENAFIVDCNGKTSYFKSISTTDELNPLETTDIEPPFVATNDDYMEMFGKCIDAIKSNRIDKIILSRILKYDLPAKPIENIYINLCEAYSNAACYLYNGKSGQWMGASPELLAATLNGVTKSVSLAGTLPMDSGEWGTKEKNEQKIVTDAISEAYNNLGKLTTVDGPHEVVAGKVRHLKTYLEGEISNHSEFIQEIHPSPAISGFPKAAAINEINNIERHQRSLYTGYFNIEIDGSQYAYVNLRCMQIIDNSAYLYLGGGITIDSDRDLEWKETEHKAQTLLQVIKKI